MTLNQRALYALLIMLGLGLSSTTTFAQFTSCSSTNEFCRTTTDCCVGYVCDERFQVCLQPGAPQCLGVGQICKSFGLPCCGSDSFCDDRVQPNKCKQRNSGGPQPPPINPVPPAGSCQKEFKHCTSQADCCNGMQCDPSLQACVYPYGPRCLAEGSSCEPNGVPCCSGSDLECDQRDLTKGPTCKRKASGSGGGGSGDGGQVCRHKGEYCGGAGDFCCGLENLQCDLVHTFTCQPPAPKECGHEGDLCGNGQNNCCQHENLYCPPFKSGRCEKRGDAPPSDPPQPPGGQPPGQPNPPAPPPINPINPPKPPPPIKDPPRVIDPPRSPQPPPPGLPRIGPVPVPGPKVKFCPDGSRCPTDWRTPEGQQNCALCKDAPPMPKPQPPAAPVKPTPKILCYLDLPSGLPDTLPSIGKGTTSTDPYLIVYPGTDILMTCSKYSSLSPYTTNLCEFVGAPLKGAGKTSLQQRYVCEATRRKQFCDAKFTGVELQVPSDVQVLEPNLTPFTYGVCAPDRQFSGELSQSNDPQVIAEDRGVFLQFSCQPHVSAGSPCFYADSEQDHYPYLAYRPSVSVLKPGVCRTYTPGVCNGSNPGIAMPRWIYPSCRKERGLVASTEAPWHATDLGQWAGEVKIGTAKTHGRFYYYHPGMVPGPVKLCLPK